MNNPGEIRYEDVEAIARGATVLGTGGGGDPYVGQLMAQQAILDEGPVQMVSPNDLPEDTFIFLCGMMGAPAVIVEKLPSGKELALAIDTLSESLNRQITHIGCLEAGGINSMMPIVAAARTGLPLVDADGMGRAFPELQMLLPTLEGISATPMSLVDDKGNKLVIDAVDNHTAEQFARNITVLMGAGATMAFYPLTGSQIAKAMVPDSYTLAYQIGKGILDARYQHADPVEEVIRQLNGYKVFFGKVVDVLRRTTEGFSRGEAILDGFGSYTGRGMQIDFQNEFLIAHRDGEVVVSTPDLICLLEAETGEPVTAERMRYGQRVVVIGAPCFHRWRSSEGLKIVGPRYFGYDCDFVPVESRN